MPFPVQRCGSITAAAVSMKAQKMTFSPYLTVTTHHYGRRSVLRLQGELDLCTKAQLCRAITGVLKRHPRILVVDLSALSFMDCSGLSVLVRAHNRLAAQQHQLLITGCTPVVRRLMSLTGLDAQLHLTAPELWWGDPGTGTPEPRRGDPGKCPDEDMQPRHGQRGCSVLTPAGSWRQAPQPKGFRHER